MNIQSEILADLQAIENGYAVCGIIDKKRRVYPLGSDTKVLSTIFELIARQAVARYAEKYSLILEEPPKQNYYPDFTLYADKSSKAKIAIDVKTTYRDSAESSFGFTLGGYRSFIQKGSERKNIVYPYSQYSHHWIIGFVYRRKKLEINSTRIFKVCEIKEIPLPFDDVEIFVQEKWRIASDKAGSGNTTNIGSIRGKMADFKKGNGPFKDEKEFLKYWRDYKTTQAERKKTYSTLKDFRELYKDKNQ